MDQDAFRQLISTAPTSSGSTSQRSFGKTAKRSAPTSSTKPADLSKPKPSRSRAGYVDRAAARRSGTLDREFSEVEALQRDFEARLAAAASEEERQVLRDQLSSVGGDARYSVLVKGLDYALLAQNKAKLGADGQDDDLEQAFNADKPKRSRDEIMDAIKKRRAAAAADDKSTGIAALSSGFRPIGKQNDEQTAVEYKWKNGKRMRKKVRPAPVPATEPEQSVASVPEPSAAPKTAAAVIASPPCESASAPPQRPRSPPQEQSSSSPPHATEEAQTTPAKANEDQSDDEDDDIFADVGGWSGIPDADETSHGPTTPQAEEHAQSDAIASASTEPVESDKSVVKASAADTAPIPARDPTPPAVATQPQPRQPQPELPRSKAEPKQETQIQAQDQEQGQEQKHELEKTQDAPPPVPTARPRSKWDALDDAAPRKKKRKSRP